MKAMLWRMIFAAVVVFVFLWVFPLFLQAIGLSLPGTLMQLIKVCVACLALLYVFFTTNDPAPF